MPRMLSLDETAKMLSISKGTLYFYIKQGMIPTIKIGKHLRICEDRLERWLREKEVSNAD